MSNGIQTISPANSVHVQLPEADATTESTPGSTLPPAPESPLFPQGNVAQTPTPMGTDQAPFQDWAALPPKLLQILSRILEDQLATSNGIGAADRGDPALPLISGDQILQSVAPEPETVRTALRDIANAFADAHAVTITSGRPQLQDNPYLSAGYKMAVQPRALAELIAAVDRGDIGVDDLNAFLVSFGIAPSTYRQALAILGRKPDLDYVILNDVAYRLVGGRLVRVLRPESPKISWLWVETAAAVFFLLFLAAAIVHFR